MAGMVRPTSLAGVDVNWYGPLAIRGWNSSAEFQQAARQAPENSLGWVLVEDGVFTSDSPQGTVCLRSGGIIRVKPEEFKRSGGGLARPGRGWLITLGGEIGLRHADFLRRRYGLVHGIRPDSAFWQEFARLRQRLPEAGADHDLLAHEWLAIYQTTLEEERVAYHEVLRLSPHDQRLEAFAGHSVKGLSQGMGCTRSHLTRILKGHWERGPGEVMRGLRLRRAHQLLRETDWPVAEIALAAGYQSISGFYSAYKNRYGGTPAELREPGARPLTEPPPEQAAVARTEIRAWPITPGEWSDAVPTTDWDGPYFQVLTCGEAIGHTLREFDVSLSTIVRRFCVVITLAGDARFATPEGTYSASPGVAISYGVPMNARWISPRQGHWRRVWLQFSGDLAARFFHQMWERHGHLHHLELHSELVESALQLVAWVRQRREDRPIFWSRHAYAWLRQWRQSVEQAPAPRSGPVRLDCGACERPPPLPRNLRDYSRITGYSLSHLHSKMSIQWNDSPGRVLRHARLDQAAKLLRTSTHPVGEVGRAAGYATPSAFIRAFAKRFGQTPLRYRQMRREAT